MHKHHASNCPSLIEFISRPPMSIGVVISALPYSPIKIHNFIVILPPFPIVFPSFCHLKILFSFPFVVVLVVFLSFSHPLSFFFCPPINFQSFSCHFPIPSHRHIVFILILGFFLSILISFIVLPSFPCHFFTLLIFLVIFGHLHVSFVILASSLCDFPIPHCLLVSQVLPKLVP